jgi:hypothetical protein
MDCRLKNFKTGKIQTKIREIQKIKNRFLFEFRQSFVWITRMILERIWEIQTKNIF